MSGGWGVGGVGRENKSVEIQSHVIEKEAE